MPMPCHHVPDLAPGRRVPGFLLLLALGACGGEQKDLSPLPRERGAVVSGAVFTAGGRPQEGAVVSMERIEDGLPASVRRAVRAASAPPAQAEEVRLVTITDRVGRFVFADLAEGEYFLEARAGHHLAAGRTVRIPAGTVPTMADTTFVDIALQPTGTFSGRAQLWEASNHQSTVVYVTGTSVVAVTNAAGDYLLRDVPIGAHTIIATHESWLDASTSGTLTAAGDSLALAPMILNRTWNIAPTVTALVPDVGEVGLPMSFQCTASDPDGSIVLYEWDFNDDGVVDYSSTTVGTTSATPAASATRAKVRVTDDDGGIAIAVANLSIYDGVYVALTGSDANSGLRGAPKATPAAAVTLAQTLTLAANRRVLMEQGTYAAAADIAAGIVNISGGHNGVTWLRSAGQRSIINFAPGMNLTKDGSMAAATYLTGLDVRQSIANDKPCVLLNGTNTLVVADCRFQAAAGVDGTVGGAGTNGTTGVAGVVGQAGSSGSSAGGGGGNGASPGGAGGLGGYASNGTAGQNGPEGTLGGAGGAVSAGCLSIAQPGNTGSNGTNGSSGLNGSSANSGITVASTIVVSSGSGGSIGSAGWSGGGGGGGGGGTGTFPCNADRGGGGGEGGGGGGFGLSGGGGLRGGCSVAVLLVAGAGVTVAFTDCALVTASAGVGGSGADGGAGGSGGNGGNGGNGADDAAAGGRGGNGGSGGAAGGGSGGAGGWSIGIVVKGGGDWAPGNTVVTLGSAGNGGAGGRLGGTGAQAPSGPNGSSLQSVLIP